MSSSKSITQKGSLPSMFSRRVVASVFFFGTVFGSGLAYGYINVVSTANVPFPTTVESNYNRIHLGMSPTEARSILGPGIEISKSESSITLVWTSSNGHIITALFKDDKLIEKKQPEP